uniref:chemerin-like receptor 1 n=1 Tax=Pristiophorus japonicus TaxID=55135 RepID=UPI00398E365C
MEPEDFQLTNSSEVPHDVSVTEDFFSMKRAMHTFIMVILIVTCFLGVWGNGLVIWATDFKLKKSANTVWLLSLADGDFTFCLLLPLFITYIALDINWPLGRMFCKLTYGVVALCLHASIFTLAAISMDRCVSVVLPIWSRNHRGPRLAALLSLGVWITAAISSAPSFVFQQLVAQGNTTQCSTQYLLEGERVESFRYPWKRALTLAHFLLSFLLPLLVIVISCSIIGLRLRWDLLAPSGSNAFRVMAAIIQAFLLCWAPYHVISILVLFHPYDGPWPLVPISYSLACINSCINPVLYISCGRTLET